MELSYASLPGFNYETSHREGLVAVASNHISRVCAAIIVADTKLHQRSTRGLLLVGYRSREQRNDI